MTTRLVKSSSVGLLCVSLVNVHQYLCMSFPFGYEGGMWDLIVLIPDHCLSIYFGAAMSLRRGEAFLEGDMSSEELSGGSDLEVSIECGFYEMTMI